MKGPFEEYITAMAAQQAEAIEAAIRSVMDAGGLSEDDLRNRGAITHWPDGRNVLTIDGVPRIEWADAELMLAESSSWTKKNPWLKECMGRRDES